MNQSLFQQLKETWCLLPQFYWIWCSVHLYTVDQKPTKNSKNSNSKIEFYICRKNFFNKQKSPIFGAKFQKSALEFFKISRLFSPNFGAKFQSSFCVSPKNPWIKIMGFPYWNILFQKLKKNYFKKFLIFKKSFFFFILNPLCYEKVYFDLSLPPPFTYLTGLPNCCFEQRKSTSTNGTSHLLVGPKKTKYDIRTKASSHSV